MMDWISADTKLPELNQFVLVVTRPNHCLYVMRRVEHHKYGWEQYPARSGKILSLEKDAISHWQSLPALPEKETL